MNYVSLKYIRSDYLGTRYGTIETRGLHYETSEYKSVIYFSIILYITIILYKLTNNMNPEYTEIT